MNLSLLKSRKVWATVLGCVIEGLAGAGVITNDIAHVIAALLGTYVLGVAIEDHGTKTGGK